MSWEMYFEKSKGRPLRPLYVKAMERLKPLPATQKVAVDLGCGAGIETEDLLQNGWEVFAYDKEESSIQSVEALVPTHLRPQLNLSCQKFEELSELPKNYLVFAYHSLPFCHVDHFDQLIKAVTDSIVKDGFFVGSFFGNNDEWVKTDKALGVHQTELQYHFSDFEFVHLNETLQVGSTMFSGPKNWHIIDVIAKKR